MSRLSRSGASSIAFLSLAFFAINSAWLNLLKSVIGSNLLYKNLPPTGTIALLFLHHPKLELARPRLQLFDLPAFARCRNLI